MEEAQSQRDPASGEVTANGHPDGAPPPVAGWGADAFTRWHIRRDLMGQTVHIPLHPDAVQRVLLDNAANYVKPRDVRRRLAPMVGDGLMMAEGDFWKTQRRLLAPSFTPQAVAALSETIAAAAVDRIADWPDRGTVDMAVAANATTLRIVTEALFSGDPRLSDAAALRRIDETLMSMDRMQTMALNPGAASVDLGGALRGARARRDLRATLAEIVGERGAEGGDGFLGGLIRGLHEGFAPDRAEALAVDNCATLYPAGHETTANTLVWGLYLMAAAPEHQARAREEAVAALAADDLAALPDRVPHLRRVVDETLRLYPPLMRLEREACEDDVLGDETIRAGDRVSVWPWLIHRHRKLWRDPDRFDPERFADGSARERHRFQYIPFGAGPRVCIGARLGMIELLVILSHWLAARRFTLAEGQKVVPAGSVTVRPQGGLPLVIEPV